jgi:tRNA 2-thiouridine synthesizing protein E
MRIFKRKGKVYDLDSDGFLLNPKKWDAELAEGLALELGVHGGLTKEHWDVIHFIRGEIEKTGKCPNLFETCRANNLRRSELKRLFPTGYMRGACKLAGVSYKEAYLGADYMEHSAKDLHAVATRQEYRVDVRGFLVDPDEWDEHYAAHRAYEMKIPGGKLGNLLQDRQDSNRDRDLRGQRHRHRGARAAVPGRLPPGCGQDRRFAVALRRLPPRWRRT